MSPIRKSERERYPPNWKAISHRIRFERAGGRCECREQCGRVHSLEDLRCKAVHGDPHPRTGSKVVLTVAHLDHTPENCSDENLLALCQDCHLRMDAELHAATRKANRCDS